jgi:hypothetical protein
MRIVICLCALCGSSVQSDEKPKRIHVFHLVVQRHENIAKAKQEYDGRAIEVRGDVWRVAEDENKKAYLLFSMDVLQGKVAVPTEVRVVRCFFKDDKTLAALKKFDPVIVYGTVGFADYTDRNKTIKSGIVVRDCVFVDKK